MSAGMSVSQDIYMGAGVCLVGGPPLQEAGIGVCGRKHAAEYWKESAGSDRRMAQHTPVSEVVRSQVQVVSCCL